MSDQIVINVVTDPPTNITISDTGENVYLNPLTLNQGIINHSVTHQSGGSDVLFHNLLGGLSGGSSGAYFHLSAAQYENLTTGSVVRPSDTGAFYPASNPSGFITGVDLSSYATISFTTGISGSLQSQITTINNATGIFVTESETGLFYPSNNPSGFITGVDLSAYVTGAVVRPSETGVFVTQSQTGQFYPASNPSGFITGVNLSSYATTSYVTGVSGALQSQITTLNSQTGSYVTGSVVRPSETGALTNVFYPRFSNPSQFITNASLIGYATTSYVTGVSGFLQTQITTLNSRTGSYVTGSVVRPSETGVFITQSQTGQFYPSSNPSGFITGVNLSGYVTGDVVRPSETGVFITQSQTGQFYAASNPSGFITGVDLSNYATIPYTTGISGSLQTQINSTNQILSTAVFVTGNQDISGLKDFQTRPTVLDVPVLVSGDAVDTIHLYGKNNQGTTIYKGQPAYINSANGANPLIQLAGNTGERTSSKTIGLLAQNLLVNEFGNIITEGILEGFDTSSGVAGDPMWLGPTGNIIYGLTNKPYGNNHLVSLGIVLRSSSNNGKVYVKVQNGFEIDELHKVYALNPSNKDTLLYDSGSGAWFARQLNTGDVSGINNYVLNSQTGQFYPTSNPSGFITGVDLTSYATTGFVTGVSGSLQTQINTLSSQTGSYVTGSVVRPSETGTFITQSQTGVFYANNNPSGYISSNESAVLTNKTINGANNTITNVSISTGISGLGANVATFLATPTSANLAAAVSDETGTGSLVFGTSPTISNPTFTNFFTSSLTDTIATCVRDGPIPKFRLFEDFGNAGVGITAGVGNNGFSFTSTAGRGSNAVYTQPFGNRGVSVLAHGINSITTGATLADLAYYFLPLGGGGMVGCSGQYCFALASATNVIVDMSIGLNANVVSFQINSALGQLNVVQGGTVGSSTTTLLSGISLSTGNFSSGTRYRFYYKIISTTEVDVYLASAPFNSTTWTTIYSGIATIPAMTLTATENLVFPYFGLRTNETATKTMYIDWIAVEKDVTR